MGRAVELGPEATGPRRPQGPGGRVGALLAQIGRLGATFTTLVSALVVLIMLNLAGIFFPQVLSYLVSLRIYELLILASLIELLFLQLRAAPSATSISINEQQALSLLQSEIASGLIGSLSILSAGLSSRYQFVIEALQSGVSVNILIQGEEIAVDKTDATRARTMLSIIERSCSRQDLQKLEVRASQRLASVRAIVAMRKKPQRKYAIVSWYTYDGHGGLMGHTSPAVLATSWKAEEGILVDFVVQQFEDSWRESEKHVIFPKAERDG